MSVLHITLTEQNSERLDDLARRTGQTPDVLANAAVERMVETAEQPPAVTGSATADPLEAEWKAAWRQAAGMWKDRDDIPELMAQLRREWNRVEPPEEPLE